MPQRTYVWIAIALLVCLFAMNVYRAATQAITIDEAFTSQLYLSKDLHTILNNYDANNHVLFTLCSKWLVNHYGNSEFTIRLASVLGGMLYLVAVYLVCRLLFGAGWLLPSGVAMLCLNPFLVDYLSVGRGYGMGLGFWMYALYCCLRFQREDKSKYLVRAGFSLGLAVAANLTMLFPSAALAGWMTLQNMHQVWRIIDRMLLPLIAIAFIVLVIPLSHVNPGNFYVGEKTLAASIQTIVSASFTSKGTALRVMQDWILAHGIPLLGAILVFCVAALLWGEEQYRAMVFIFAAAMAQLVAAHYAVGLLYPYGRTGLYLVPIFSLMWLLAVRDTGQWPRIQFLAAVPFCVCIALFVGQTNRTAYAEWLFCASTKTVAKILRQNGAVRVGVSWPLEPSLNYYRQRYRITGMQPITRESPDGNYDHFVLLPEDYSLVAKRQLKVVFQDDESKVLVAVPR